MNDAVRTTSSLTLKTPEYILSGGYNDKKDRFEIVMRSREGGKNFATHTHYNLLASDGSFLERLPITADVAEYILNNFARRGDTHSFEIFEHEIRFARDR